MESRAPASVVNDENAADKKTKSSKGKVPKRIHKSEREKLKREQLNENFLELAAAVESNHPNNGKAFILNEAIVLLKDLAGQIESLKKENASLSSESHYVTVERNELKEENSVLQTDVDKLHGEIQSRLVHSNPDLNAPPPELESLRDVPVQHQEPAVFVLPFHPDLQGYPMINTNVSKPHARYPTPSDSWPSKLLGDHLVGRKELDLNNNTSNSSIFNNGV